MTVFLKHLVPCHSSSWTKCKGLYLSMSLELFTSLGWPSTSSHPFQITEVPSGFSPLDKKSGKFWITMNTFPSLSHPSCTGDVGNSLYYIRQKNVEFCFPQRKKKLKRSIDSKQTMHVPYYDHSKVASK